MIRINSTLWAVAIRKFQPRRTVPEVIFVHKKKREEEEKVVENEEASKSINKLPKKGES